MMIHAVVRSLALGLVLLISTTHGAFAHGQHGEAAGFLSGVHHPLSGLDHMVAMIAVGLWGSLLGGAARWLLPACFLAAMGVGGALGVAAGVPLTGVEGAVALSGVVLGAAILFQRHARLPAAAALVSLFAVFHGYAHGAEAPLGQSLALYGLGFVLCTGALHGLGLLLGSARRWSWGCAAARAGGLAIALTGGVFLVAAMAA